MNLVLFILIFLMKCKDCQIEKKLNLIKNDKIDIDLINNHKNIVNSFATKVNLKKFTGPEYTGI
jgi:hypothetical protein